MLTSTRFSVGTGKSCVFETDTLSQLTAIVLESQETSRDDKSTAIELDLYVHLYKCVVQTVVQIDQTKTRCQDWKVRHDDRSYCSLPGRHPQLTFTVLRGDVRLKLGYSSAMLILERWDLAQMPAGDSATSHQEADYIISLANGKMRSVANRAIEVLSALQILTAACGTTPMYDNLLGTYAGVTLAQFADVLTDIRGAADLMRQVDQQRKSRLRSREPVLTWANSMMQRKSLDLGGADADDHLQVDAEMDWPRAVQPQDPASFLDSLITMQYDDGELQ